jgi:hypothetical protein
MATDIVGSLFGVTPEMLQQRQFEMADRQAQEYAQLTPLQRASYGLARGGYQLAGALGGEDPQLRMVSTRNAIARQTDPTDPQSMMRGIQALQQAGDQVGAMQLAQVLRQVEGDIAQRFQREAAGEASLAAARRERVQATPEKIQLARELASQRGAPGTPEYQEAYNAELTRLTTTGESATPEMRNAAALAARKGAPGSPEYEIEYQTQLSRLTTRTEGREPTTNELTNARAFAATQGAPGSPEYNAAFSEEYKRLTAPKETREATSTEVTNARALAALAGPVGSAEYNAEFRTQLTRLTTKPEARQATTNEIQNATALALTAGPIGSPEYEAEFKKQLSRLTTKPEGREPTTPELTNARAIAAQAGAPGSPEYEAAFKVEYNRLTGPKELKPPTTNELTNARAIALQAGPEGSAEYNAAFVAEYNRLTQKEAQKPEIARLQALRDSYAPGSQARKEVQDRIDALGKGSRVEVNIDNKQLGAFAQARGTDQAKVLGEAEASARAAATALSTISSMKQLNASGQLFTGPLANAYVGATNLLASVGLLSQDQASRLAKSEIYDKQAKDLVMQDLGGKLGAQISDADRKFVEARIPQLATSEKARTELLNKLEEIQRGKISYQRRMTEHANKFGNLNTFDFSQQYAPVAPAAGWSIRRSGQ